VNTGDSSEFSDFRPLARSTYYGMLPWG